MSRGNCMRYERAGYAMLATDNCWIFEFDGDNRPALFEISYSLGDGSRLHVGDRIKRLRGNHRSAAFRDLHLLAGHLEYLGAWREPHLGQSAISLLFRYSECQVDGVYYGFGVAAVAPLQLCFSTPAIASRVVETTRVDRA